MSFSWEQIGGAPVVLQDAGTPTPSFEAPQWDGSTELTVEEATLIFRLTTNQGMAAESTDDVEVFIRIPGDGNGDDAVNAFDVATFRHLSPESDFNQDGAVNANDLAILRQNGARRRAHTIR